MINGEKIMKPTPRTQIKRQPDRGSYDKEFIKGIINECLIGHLAFNLAGSVHSIPLPFWCYQDAIYFHCSIASRLVKLTESKSDCCISFTIVDGYVLAKSAIKHSMNYRSAVLYGRPELATTEQEKLSAFEIFINLLEKNRWSSIRIPNHKELNATAMLKISLTEAVAKMRQGPPKDLQADLALNIWAGVIPITKEQGSPIPHHPL